MPKLTIGVSNVNRSNGGVRYTITRNDDSRIAVGYVEMVNSFWNIRDACDEPIKVGSAKYLEMQMAVTKYQEWAEKYQCPACGGSTASKPEPWCNQKDWHIGRSPERTD